MNILNTPTSLKDAYNKLNLHIAEGKTLKDYVSDTDNVEHKFGNFKNKTNNLLAQDFDKWKNDVQKQIFLSPPEKVLRELIKSFGDIYSDDKKSKNGESKIDIVTSSSFEEVNNEAKDLNKTRDGIQQKYGNTQLLLPHFNDSHFQKFIYYKEKDNNNK